MNGEKQQQMKAGISAPAAREWVNFIKSCAAAARARQYLGARRVELAHPSDLLLCCFHGKGSFFLQPPLFVTSSTLHAAHFGSQHAVETQ